MAKYKDSWAAYGKGNRDFYAGKSFSANPYKTPGRHIEWAQGWLAAKERPKTGVVSARLRKHYGG